jgi:hypothetical protein
MLGSNLCIIVRIKQYNAINMSRRQNAKFVISYLAV